MKIAISGSSGFIGGELTCFFEKKGFEVVPLSRSLFDSASGNSLSAVLSGCSVVINLAGATINHRWTDEYKQLILDSRVHTTRKLVDAINQLERKPDLFISVSAVGIYPSEGKYTDESPEQATGFLSQVCRQWEAEARNVDSTVRLMIPRFGVVLDEKGGALPKMLLPFRLFAGGKMASGCQGFSWIHIDDLKNAFQFIIDHSELSGTINFTAPYPVTNAEFSVVAAHVLHRPHWLRLPGFVFRLLYGEGHVLMTGGQFVYPTLLQENGYSFRYPTLDRALQNLVG